MRPVSCCMLRRPQPHSHKDCGAACLARGVPLANCGRRRRFLLSRRWQSRAQEPPQCPVRASGTVVEKHDPMELKMPVGDKNQMVVRLEGGYKQITIKTLSRIPAKKG